MPAQAIPVKVVRLLRIPFQFFDFLENRKRINTSTHRNHLSSVVQKRTPLTLPSTATVMPTAISADKRENREE